MTPSNQSLLHTAQIALAHQAMLLDPDIFVLWHQPRLEVSIQSYLPLMMPLAHYALDQFFPSARVADHENEPNLQFPPVGKREFPHHETIFHVLSAHLFAHDLAN
ncbi:hypothetical protein D3C81_895820 [compost metagenome]